MSKPPRAVFENVFAFSPNRHTLGGTAYLIVGISSSNGTTPGQNLLIDAPPWDEETEAFLRDRGGARWLFLTHRGSIGKARKIQQETGCAIVIQEREAYLLPESQVTTFEREWCLGDRIAALWTPGHSPGSSCLFYDGWGGILFTGRHLLPDRDGNPAPLRVAKTFHWPRQMRSVGLLRDRFTAETLHYICPGANVGFLRGKTTIDRAYEKLAALDLDACARDRPPL